MSTTSVSSLIGLASSTFLMMRLGTTFCVTSLAVVGGLLLGGGLAASACAVRERQRQCEGERRRSAQIFFMGGFPLEGLGCQEDAGAANQACASDGSARPVACARSSTCQKWR